MMASSKDLPGSSMVGALAERTGARLTSTKRRLAEVLIVFVLTCLGGMGWLAWQNMHTGNASDRLETHSRIVIQQWSDLFSSLKDAETGQRGFIITGNPEYLAPYDASLDTLSTLLADLHRLTGDNSAQQQQIATITPLVEARLASLENGIVLRKTQGFTAARQSVMTQSGKNIMDQIRVLVGQAQAQEQRLLNDRAATNETDSLKLIQSVFFATALGGLALLLLVSFLRWELRGRRQAETAVDASEVQYRTLFNSMDEGFCILEIIFDHDDKPVDYRCVEVNPGFEKQTGLSGAAGKCISEIVPGPTAEIIEMYAKVLRSGEPARFVKESTALNRWFDVYAFRISGPLGAKVAVLFSDITRRKHEEDTLIQSNCELTAFNRVAVNRELRMIELKHEVNGLCGQGGQPPRYDLAFEKEQA